MPHHKSAARRLRTNEKSRRRNQTVKSALRKVLKQQRQAAPGDASSLLPRTASALDRAARKRVIPKGRARRVKSRLTRTANRAEP